MKLKIMIVSLNRAFEQVHPSSSVTSGSLGPKSVSSFLHGQFSFLRLETVSF